MLSRRHYDVATHTSFNRRFQDVILHTFSKRRKIRLQYVVIWTSSRRRTSDVFKMSYIGCLLSDVMTTSDLVVRRRDRFQMS